MSDNAKYTKNDGRTLTDEGKDAFAYEVALGYFSDEEMRRRFKLRPSAYEVILASEEVQDLILDKKRELDESDFALRVHARRAARVALEQCILIVKDEEAPARTRMDASKQIREIASGVDKDVLRGGGDAGEGAIIIKTNLGLEDTSGVYAITAAEISEQVEENDRIRAENNDLSSARDAEIMALIGE